MIPMPDVITMTMVYGQAKKDTKFVYNTEMDKYIWNQYGKEMRDQITNELEGFTNVIIVVADDHAVLITDQHKAVLADVTVMCCILNLRVDFTLEALRVIPDLHKAVFRGESRIFPQDAAVQRDGLIALHIARIAAQH